MSRSMRYLMAATGEPPEDPEGRRGGWAPAVPDWPRQADEVALVPAS